MTSNHAVPKPGWRLLRTILRRPRDLSRFIRHVSDSYPPMDQESSRRFCECNEYSLVDDRTVVLHRDGTVSERWRYVAVLNGSEALAMWDNSTRFYDRRAWRPAVLRAVARTPDGRTHQATVSNRSIGKFGRDRMLSVSFHHLRPGTIVDYEEQRDVFHPYQIAPGVWGEFWHQTPAPCDLRRSTLAVARRFTAAYKLHNGAEPPRETTVGRYQVFRWVLHNVSGVRWDPWTPPPSEFLPWVEYSTLPTWEPVAKHFSRQLQPPLGTTASTRNLARALTE